MNLKPSFKALVAVLLAGIAAAACSIKEDRDECPCWLTVTLTDGGRSVPEPSGTPWSSFAKPSVRMTIRKALNARSRRVW